MRRRSAPLQWKTDALLQLLRGGGRSFPRSRARSRARCRARSGVQAAPASHEERVVVEMRQRAQLTAAE